MHPSLPIPDHGRLRHSRTALAHSLSPAAWREALEFRSADATVAPALANNGTDAQLFVFFIMVVAAAEVTVGLAIIVMMYRNIHSVDVNFLNRLKN